MIYSRYQIVQSISPAIRWASLGDTGLVPSGSHKRPYHNWQVYGVGVDAIVWQSAGSSDVPTPTPTPTPTPAQVVVPSAGGSYGIQDNYWREVERRYEKKKKQAKKKSKKAVEIVEDLARQELALSEAIDMLHEELAAANVKNQEIYVELLKLKLEIVEEEEADDDFLLLH